MKVELPEFILELAKQVNEQPNRGTSHPFYQVRCKRYVITASGYNENHWELFDEDLGNTIYSSNESHDNDGYIDDMLDNYPHWCDDWVKNKIDDGDLDDDAEFADHFDAEDLDQYSDLPEGVSIHYMQEIEEVVSTHLTLSDAEWFIKRKQHDYPKLYTYAESAYWSPQIKQLQDWLKSLCNENQSKEV